MGFPHLEPYFVMFKGITERSSLFCLVLSLYPPLPFFFSFVQSSEDLKGPETKPQLV